MSSPLASLFPGVDLCSLPSATPPDGRASNFNNPPSLEALSISINAVFSFWAFAFAVGRLWANRLKLSWSDGKQAVQLQETLNMRHSIL